MFTRKTAIVILACLVLFGAVFGFVIFRNHMIAQYLANRTKPTVTVTAAPVQVASWGDEIQAIGTLEAKQGVNVSSSVAGTIQKIEFESGSTTVAGAPLVQLDVDIESANLRVEQSQRDLAGANLKRTEGLRAGSYISRAQIDKDEAEFRTATARVDALNAQISKKKILAPFSGTLGIRQVNVGQYISPGQTIVNLQDTSTILANFTVSQKDLPKLSIGLPLRLSTDAYPGRTFKGTISAIEPSITAQNGMVKLQGSFDNGENLLRPGMFATLFIELAASADAVVVPQTAINYTLYGDSVFVVRDGRNAKDEPIKTVERVKVEVGERRGDLIALKSGVKPGDLIVTFGQLKLDNGSPVSLSDEGTPKTPSTLPRE